MSSQTILAHADHRNLSEKARRLLAAHDREVSRFHRERPVLTAG